jgi:maleylpyruvate isomerase
MSVAEVSDPARLRELVDGSTGRMLATVSALTDEQVRAASPLPGWTRGHVLTHIARNADGLRNLLIWAHTGVVTPQYRDAQARNAEIEAGAGRAAGELAADVRESAARFAAQAGQLTDGDWQVMVSGLRGPEHPAWVVLRRRLSEVEFHHVDLDAGYRPADWPDWFVAEQLESAAGGFAEDGDAPAVLMTDDGTGRTYRTGPDPEVTVAGPGCELLAWLSGRSRGIGLAVSPAGPPPQMPPW